jgi:hypothetical protein
VLPLRLRQRVDALRSSVVTMAPEGDEIDADLLVALAQACEGHERVTITYRDREGRESERRTEPYRLVSTGRRWYLLADDVDRRDWRTFRVDRITGATRTGHRFTPRDPPDAAAMVSRAITTAPYRHQAVVRFDAPAQLLAARIPPTVGTVRPDRGGSILSVGADDLAYLAGHLIGLDLPFEVLEPTELRTTSTSSAAGSPPPTGPGTARALSADPGPTGGARARRGPAQAAPERRRQAPGGTSGEARPAAVADGPAGGGRVGDRLPSLAHDQLARRRQLGGDGPHRGHRLPPPGGRHHPGHVGGQIVVPSARDRSSARAVAITRSGDASPGARSHHGAPRSPSATLASCTRRRAAATATASPPAARTARRAAISSRTSSVRSGAGMVGSVARHRRPSTTMKRSSPPPPPPGGPADDGTAPAGATALSPGGGGCPGSAGRW